MKILLFPKSFLSTPKNSVVFNDCTLMTLVFVVSILEDVKKCQKKKKNDCTLMTLAFVVSILEDLLKLLFNKANIITQGGFQKITDWHVLFLQIYLTR